MVHVAGHYYHVYNRGVNRQPIFSDQGNYDFLLRRIRHFLPDYDLTFIAYCLMPNHYHFLIRVESDGELSPFIQRLFNSYTQAYNRQQKRSGTLFEGRAKSKLVPEAKYLLHLVRYIHLNPVQAGLIENPYNWQYSNYLVWTGHRQGTLYDPDLAIEFFSDPAEYEDFVLSEIPSNLERRLRKYTLE